MRAVIAYFAFSMFFLAVAERNLLTSSVEMLYYEQYKVRAYQVRDDVMVEFPSDLILWQGISLAGVLSILTQLLKQFGIFDRYKKLIPFVLGVLSGVSGGAYYVSVNGFDDPTMILFNFVAGVIIAFNAVGIHSSIKNTYQFVKSQFLKFNKR